MATKLYYKSPGPKVHHGVSCQTLTVEGPTTDDPKKDKKAFNKACKQAEKDGWCETPAEAGEAAEAENTPPTREELEAEAKRLGVKFPKNIKDETLAARILEAADKASDEIE